MHVFNLKFNKKRRNITLFFCLSIIPHSLINYFNIVLEYSFNIYAQIIFSGNLCIETSMFRIKIICFFKDQYFARLSVITDTFLKKSLRFRESKNQGIALVIK